MAKSIVITSGKSGCGKTCITLNVATELVKHGHRTCIFDAELGLANPSAQPDTPSQKTLDDVLSGGASLPEIIIRTESGLEVMPGTSRIESIISLHQQQFFDLLEQLSRRIDHEYLLIDISFRMSRSVISLCLAADEIMLVMTSGPTSLREAYAVLQVLSQNAYRGRVSVVVNKCTTVAQAKKIYLHFKSVVAEQLQIVIHSGRAVLADSLLDTSISLQYPAVDFHPEAVFAQCIRALAAGLVSPEADGITPENGFWQRCAEVLGGNLLLSLPGVGDDAHGQAIPPGLHADGQQAGPTATAMQNIPLPRSSTLANNSGLFAVEGWSGTLPLYGRILSLAGEGQLDRQRMLQLVRFDPLLLVQFFLLTNSTMPPFPSGGHGPFKLELAVEESEEDSLRRMLVSIALHQLLGGASRAIWDGARKFWYHSCHCGLLCATLSDMLGYPAKEKAFIAGMLHDVGRLELQGRFPSVYEPESPPHAHDPEVLAFEQSVAGMTHAELGAKILTSVGLDRAIAEAARYHAEIPDRIMSALDLTRLVGISHMLANRDEERKLKAVAVAREVFHLSSDQIAFCLETVSQELNRRAAEFGIAPYNSIDDLETQVKLDSLRQQAITFATMQTLLPSLGRENGRQKEARLLCDGLRLLFGLSRAIVLLPDSGRLNLRAVNCADCYGTEFVQNVAFAIASSKSQVVATYAMARSGFLAADDDLSIADRQLLRLMHAEMMLCVMLDFSGKSAGLVVCGLERRDMQYVARHLDAIKIFCHRAAARLLAAIP
jgi:flagellar biosynthesis protein FlhG